MTNVQNDMTRPVLAAQTPPPSANITRSANSESSSNTAPSHTEAEAQKQHSTTSVAEPEKGLFESLGDWLFGDDETGSSSTDATQNAPSESKPESKKEDKPWWDSLLDTAGKAAGKWISSWLSGDGDGKNKAQANATHGGSSAGTASATTTQSTTAGAPNEVPAGSSPANASFENLLAAVLPEGDANTPVSEEDLFAAVLHERIATQVGAEAASAFLDALRNEVGARIRTDGYQPVEEATIAALQKLVADGALTTEQGDALYAQAVHAAQLDGDASALFDGRGGPGDATIATLPRTEAIAKALEHVQAIDAGEVYPPRSLADASATGATPANTDRTETGSHVGKGDAKTGGKSGSIDGPNGFLWKPSSDSDGNLVVLLPKNWENAKSVIVTDPEGRVLARGESRGRANGDREHFRFDQPGAAFPPGSIVEVKLHGGRIETITIPDPAGRWD